MTRRVARRAIPRDVRRRVRQQPCAKCGAPPPSEVDHIVPLQFGGEDNEANLQPLCVRCHKRKTARQKSVAGKAGSAPTGPFRYQPLTYKPLNGPQNPRG